MKRLAIALVMMMATLFSANAMSYEQARDRALFLTDKMAYELNLTDAQYEAAYEVNLDYLMSIGTYDDLYGTYWDRRNLDLSYILYDWQYTAYCAASYFYRPLIWADGIWRFSIYARYPHRTFFYFGRPTFYASYRGGHSWGHNGGRSWYHGRDFGHGRPEGNMGMRDRFDRGDFHGQRGGGQGNMGNRGQGNFNNNRGNMGNNRGNNNQGNRGQMNGQRNNAQQSGATFNRGIQPNSTRMNGSFNRGNSTTPQRNQNTGTVNSSSWRDRVNSAGKVDQSKKVDFNTRQSSTRTTVTQPSTGSMRGNVRNSGSSLNRVTPSGNYNNSRQVSRPSGAFTPSHSSGPSRSSMSAPSRSSSSSMSGGSHSGGSRGGGNSGGGSRGGSFGGRR